jgi:uncharacterized protein YegL
MEEKTFGGDFEPIARRQLPLFFMIDCSGSMEGSKINTVNTVMRELLPELAGVGEADADVRVAVLTFANGAKWMTSAPQPPEQIEWKELEAYGLTDLGEASIELEKKLSRKEFLSGLGSTFAPVIILLTDGEPTDDYKKGFDALWKNNWFKHAMKLALPIGRDTELDVLEAFTRVKEAVLKPVTTAAELRKMLKMISITSTSFASRSNIIPDDEDGPVTKYDALLDEVNRAQDEDGILDAEGASPADITADDTGEW